LAFGLLISVGLASWVTPHGYPAPPVARPRVLILTDISSLRTGEAEPDDGQSLIRLLFYTNDLDVEGLVASSNLGHGQRVRPELIRQVLDAYAEVRPTLVQHDPNYPTADRLRSLVKAGQPLAGPKVPVTTSIGPDRDTEASEWIIRVVDQPDPRPVWVCLWGGSADLAQALWKIRQSRSPEAVRAFTRKLRVHAVYDQDATGAWIRAQFPELLYVLRHHGIRGMYRGGDARLVDSAWVETHVRQGHGPLGALYPNYRGGDIWSGKLGRVRGIKEGDTPSFLALLPNGLNVPEHPEWGGWGGRFVQDSAQRLTEAVDSVAAYQTDPDPRMAALYRWRTHWQDDFAARLDWCVQSYAQANHPPVATLAGYPNEGQPIVRTVRPGQVIRLDARRSSDPDGDSLRYAWQVYPERRVPGFSFSETNTPSLTFRVPGTFRDGELSLLLTVTDSGRPALRRYRRVVLRVR
jgi:hypothetical protein